MGESCDAASLLHSKKRTMIRHPLPATPRSEDAAAAKKPPPPLATILIPSRGVLAARGLRRSIRDTDRGAVALDTFIAQNTVERDGRVL
jgi:hypothetical protein